MNIGAAIHRMVEIALDTMEKSGFKEGEEWISLSKVFGNVAVPMEDYLIIAKTVKDMIANGEVDKSRKWEALKLLAQKYDGKEK